MNRLVMKAIIEIFAKSILFAAIVGVVIGIIGYINKWDTPLAYSNAFFLAGSLVIVAGVFSRLGSGDDWNFFQLLSAESFRGMSSGERANFIVNTSSPIRNLILSVLSGILLIVVSLIAAKIS